MNRLVQFDISLFSKINGEWHTPFLDWLLPFLRNQFFWAPLYLFLVVFMIANFGKRGIFWLGFFLVSFALGDIFSSHIIKPLVGRLRPCNEPLLADTVRTLVGCGSGKSFTSSHATNHFALGVFCYRSLLFTNSFWRWAFIAWAIAISYAQVYVGVHYPLDVLGGALLGTLIGWLTSTVFNKKFGLS